MKVALVQMHCEKGQVSRNLARTVEYIDRASSAGADVICFPEMSVTGYVEPRKQPEAVLSWDDPQLAPLFGSSSKHSQMTVIAGIAERNPGNKPFISQGIIRSGELLGVYRKINVHEDEVGSFSPGSEPLTKHIGYARTGIAICADVDSESLFRKYAQDRATVVLVSAAPGLYGSQETRAWEAGYAWWRDKCRAQLGEYAKKYGLHIAVATQAGRTVDEDFPGGGYLFDDQGAVIAETADWSEGMLLVDIQATSSPSEDYLTVLAGQRQWIATTNFAGCPGRPPDSFANSAVLTTSAKVPDALGWPIDPCFPVQIDPKAAGGTVVLVSAAPGLYGSQETRAWEAGYAWWRDKCRAQLGEYAKKYGLHIAVATQAGRTVDEDFPGGGYLFDDQGAVIAETADWSEGMLLVDIQATSGAAQPTA